MTNMQLQLLKDGLVQRLLAIQASVEIHQRLSVLTRKTQKKDMQWKKVTADHLAKKVSNYFKDKEFNIEVLKRFLIKELRRVEDWLRRLGNEN